MSKISIFAPSIMRNKLSATEFGQFAPNVFGRQDLGGRHDKEVFEWHANGHDEAQKRRSELHIHKQNVKSWFESVLNLCLYADELWIPSVFLGGQSHTSATNEPRRTRLNTWYDAPGWQQEGLVAVHYEYSKSWIEYGSEFRAFFKAISPLVHAGIIRIYNFSHIYMEDVSESLLGEKRWMTQNEIDHSYPELFVAEGLLFAKALGVPYTSTRMEEIDAINMSVAHIEGLLPTDRKAVTLLSEAALPGMNIAPEAIVAARLDSEAFDGFRRIIRQVSRDLPEIISSSSDIKELKLLESDLLLPEIDRLNAAVSKSGLLARSLKPNAISFSAGALASLALRADPSIALASGALTTLGRVVLTELFDKQELAPEARFISHLRTN